MNKVDSEIDNIDLQCLPYKGENYTREQHMLHRIEEIDEKKI